jgi:hypothetical protein
MDTGNSIDTISAFSSGGSMGDSANTVSMEQLLSQQLHGLIDLTTLLTRRLLQLEQKVQQLEADPQHDDGAERAVTEALLEQGDLQMQELQSLLAVVPSASTPELTVIDGLRDQEDGEAAEALSQDALDDGACSGSDDPTDEDGAVAESMDDQGSEELQAEPETFDDGGFIDERHGEPASDEGFEDDDSQMPLLSA